MKTHDLAKALLQLSRALQAGPNVDIGKLQLLLESASAPRRERPNDAEIALNVSTLVAMSRIGKQQWRELIKEWGIPLEIPTSYSARDIIGKLLNYLDANPKAYEQMRRRAAGSKASPELLRALETIMGGSRK